MRSIQYTVKVFPMMEWTHEDFRTEKSMHCWEEHMQEWKRSLSLGGEEPLPTKLSGSQPLSCGRPTNYQGVRTM